MVKRSLSDIGSKPLISILPSQDEMMSVVASSKEDRCLDFCIDSKTPSAPLDFLSLPLPFIELPSTVGGLKDCAEFHICSLLKKTTLSADDEDALDDGFVLCDLNIIRKKLQVWRQLFPRVRPLFALKCNPDPMVAAVLGQSGVCGFDCASLPEVELALKSVSNNPRLLVYANPQRAEKDLEMALSLGVRALTFDGPEELHKVHRAYQQRLAAQSNSRPPQMILRILVPDESSTVPLGEKFGASPARIASLANLALTLGLRIIGVSFHCGSGNHDPRAYRIAIELAAEAIQTIDLVQKDHKAACWLLDIGGGYPGLDGMGGDAGRFCGSKVKLDESLVQEDETETTEKVSNIVSPLLNKLFPHEQIHFVSEPGRYFVEGAFALCSRIYQAQSEYASESRHTVVRRHYFIAQGVQGMFKDCLLCNEVFTPVPLFVDSCCTDVIRIPSVIHGPSGELYDIIARDHPLPFLEAGDWLLFDRMGAYTLSIAARSDRPPIRYVIGGTAISP